MGVLNSWGGSVGEVRFLGHPGFPQNVIVIVKKCLKIFFYEWQLSGKVKHSILLNILIYLLKVNFSLLIYLLKPKYICQLTLLWPICAPTEFIRQKSCILKSFSFFSRSTE